MFVKCISIILKDKNKAIYVKSGSLYNDNLLLEFPYRRSREMQRDINIILWKTCFVKSHTGSEFQGFIASFLCLYYFAFKQPPSVYTKRPHTANEHQEFFSNFAFPFQLLTYEAIFGVHRWVELNVYVSEDIIIFTPDAKEQTMKTHGKSQTLQRLRE